MQHRTEEMIQFMEGIMEEQFQIACIKIQKLYDRNANSIEEEILEAFGKLFELSMEIQKKSAKGKIKYIIISYLQSCTAAGRWGFRAETLDDGFYLDEEEAAVYYYPDFLWNFFEKDIEYFEARLKENYRRVQKYEMDEIRNHYILSYNAIFLSLILDLIPQIQQELDISEMHKDERYRILFGDYMEKTIRLNYRRG